MPRDRAFDRVPIEAFGRKNLYPVEVVEKQFNSLRVGDRRVAREKLLISKTTVNAV